LRRRLGGELASSVASAYDRWASTYDTDINRTRDLDASVVRRSAPKVDGRDVLELGPGTGKNTTWIAQRARSVVGLDASAGMLAIAQARVVADGVADRVHFVRHDITAAWLIASASIDVVIGDLVLEHVEDVGHVFAEAARVLRPAGNVFICELHPIRQFLGGRAHFVDAASGEVVDVPVFRHTVGEFVNRGVEAGLVVERADEWPDEGHSEAPPRLLSVLFGKR
jgi:ubiquinone/menaquinone biosynthesis C-methylase UbiE